jgi:hypothetical protein
MASRVFVVSELGRRFSQFEQVADITARLDATFAQINTYNRTAAGDHDTVAVAYHKQVDPATEALGGLLKALHQVLTQVGVTGKDVTNTFLATDQTLTGQLNQQS